MIGSDGASAIAQALKVNKTVHTIDVDGKWFQNVFFWVEFELNLTEVIVCCEGFCIKCN